MLAPERTESVVVMEGLSSGPSPPIGDREDESQPDTTTPGSFKYGEKIKSSMNTVYLFLASCYRFVNRCSQLCSKMVTTSC